MAEICFIRIKLENYTELTTKSAGELNVYISELQFSFWNVRKIILDKRYKLIQNEDKAIILKKRLSEHFLSAVEKPADISK